MIVVDASALVAIFAEEPGFEDCLRLLSSDDAAYLPVSAYVEFLLISRLRENRRAWLDELVGRRVLLLAPLEPAHGAVAADAARRFGKGSGHPAQLNFGDCLVYAIAHYGDLPLLFVGNDFIHTDITPALAVSP